MTTIETLTNRQIAQLQQEAAQAGDQATVDDCELALGGYDSSLKAVAGAKARIVKVLNEAEARSGE